MSKKSIFGLLGGALVAGLLALAFAPSSAVACGFKSFGYNASVSYSGTHAGDVKGDVVVFGDTQVSRRLALGLRAAGHKVRRATSIDDAKGADVILSKQENLAAIKQGIPGARVVVILAANETSTGVEYAINTDDRSNTQLAMVEKAIRAAKAGV
jgi:hypothetical protein